MIDGDDEEATRITGGPRPVLRYEPLVLRIFRAKATAKVLLLEGRETQIGRSRPADVVIADPTLSRRHASLSWHDHRLMLRDLGSSNGTFVNGRRVTDAIEVRPGDRIELGAVVARVSLDDEAGSGHRLVPYEQLAGALRHELARSRTYGSSVSLLFIRCVSPLDRHISLWLTHVEAALGDADSVATFGLESALVLLPETEVDGAVATAQRIRSNATAAGIPLVVGAVSAPAHGRAVDLLVETATNLVDDDYGAGVRYPDGSRKASPPNGMLVLSDAMREVDELVSRVAATDIPVLVHGETGTGKELVAMAVWTRSDRAEASFRSVNCGSIAASLMESTLFGHERGAFTGADRAHEGLFQQADGGTLFLDEIGELSASAQAALLRVLETGRLTRLGGREEIAVDVRVIAATHRDLQAMSARGEFRLDLLYRLNTVIIEVPPLRERRNEIEPLARHFLKLCAAKHRRRVEDLSPEVVEALVAQSWPGNGRELRNVVERATVIASGDVVQIDALPRSLRGVSLEDTQRVTIPPEDPGSGRPFKKRVQGFERQLMVEALERSGGNKTAAAKELDMPLRTFMNKLKAYAIDT